VSETISPSVANSSSWFKDVAALFKLRLTMLVVMSSVFGYLMATSNGGFSWSGLFLLVLSGMLITGASNTFNQVIEVEQDGLMNRTQGRPLVRETFKRKEAILLASVSGLVGVTLLFLTFGQLSAVLGLMALVSYAAIYTPLKRITSWSVFVGAFPGAIPPMLGYVAATDSFGLEPGLLFATQFIWQFVHFWAIAWVLDDDYRKAGFFMLPSKGGRDSSSAYLILLYTLFVFPVSVLPWVFGITGIVSLVVCLIAGMILLVPAVRLFRTRDMKYARQLMFASFIHLPMVQLVYVLDKL
jgi:protoheme IX farnesyltransferase